MIVVLFFIVFTPFLLININTSTTNVLFLASDTPLSFDFKVLSGVARLERVVGTFQHGGHAPLSGASLWTARLSFVCGHFRF